MEDVTLFFFSDIDECSANVGLCDFNASCINTLGSYKCLCHPGFTGDGQNCTGRYKVWSPFPKVERWFIKGARGEICRFSCSSYFNLWKRL